MAVMNDWSSSLPRRPYIPRLFIVISVGSGSSPSICISSSSPEPPPASRGAEDPLTFLDPPVSQPRHHRHQTRQQLSPHWFAPVRLSAGCQSRQTACQPAVNDCQSDDRSHLHPLRSFCSESNFPARSLQQLQLTSLIYSADHRSLIHLRSTCLWFLQPNSDPRHLHFANPPLSSTTRSSWRDLDLFYSSRQDPANHQISQILLWFSAADPNSTRLTLACSMADAKSD